MISLSAVDEYFERMFELARRVHTGLTQAGIEYRIVGGVAVFLHINELDPLAARLTPDVDVAIDRKNLEKVAAIAGKHGFRYADGAWTADQPRSAVHFLFIGEKARPNHLEAVPGFSPPIVTKDGILLAPVADLVRLKLTSFRLKDKVHIIDLDSVGLITREIEQASPDALRDRLEQVRQEERQSTGAE
ncbi:MAG TPA: hypothetical protein VNX70_19855 [Bryobacteraceae bacterium]|nr:hypothetical protein [Bryobacteraceae bacterium]